MMTNPTKFHAFCFNGQMIFAPTGLVYWANNDLPLRVWKQNPCVLLRRGSGGQGCTGFNTLFV